MTVPERNLIVCCDGTMNEPQIPTNVKLLKDAVIRYRKPKPERPVQIVHYEKGVGTRAFEAVRGGLYGFGLNERILRSYRFLSDSFKQSGWSHEQNHIYLFGFSRGAYTARRIAGLLSHSGLPKRAKDEELGWELYESKNAQGARDLKKEGRFYDVRVRMVGVWDTVKATNDDDYDDKVLPKNVDVGYHAMAIDERRKFFPILRWKPDEERVHEMWFAGVHSDVGGGYEDSQGLSNLALEWMMYRAIGVGLRLDQAKVDAVRGLSVAKMHDSMTTFWKPLGSIQRKIRIADPVHYSVRTRISRTRKKAKRYKTYKAYKPSNLPKQPKYWEPE